MSKVAEKIMACVHGGDELRKLLGHEPADPTIIRSIEDVFGERLHINLFSEIARQIQQEESEMRDFCERVEDAAKDKEELDLFGVAYIPLPTDADGVPVRVGDMLQGRRCGIGWLKPFEVDRLILERNGWTAHERTGAEYFVNMCRHYHATTVEDVLRDFAYCFEDGVTDKSLDEIVAEYAPKIQLREED